MAKTRTMRKEIRLSEAEIKRIESDAKEKGMNFSQYVRYLAKNKPKEHPDVIKVFKKLINEINHIGTNINQIARNCNSGIYTYEDKRRLFAYIKSVNFKLKEVIDLYGNQ